MPRKRNERKPQAGKPAAAGGTHIQWVWFALAVGLAFGGASGYFIGKEATAATSGYTDAYGRSPGHPHYRHDHP